MKLDGKIMSGFLTFEDLTASISFNSVAVQNSTGICSITVISKYKYSFVCIDTLQYRNTFSMKCTNVSGFIIIHPLYSMLCTVNLGVHNCFVFSQIQSHVTT